MSEQGRKQEVGTLIRAHPRRSILALAYHNTSLRAPVVTKVDAIKTLFRGTLDSILYIHSHTHTLTKKTVSYLYIVCINHMPQAVDCLMHVEQIHGVGQKHLLLGVAFYRQMH